ncbi:MAG: winged helix-turn-helix transcriptional regulator [Erysipelotrichaceae bacterium]|nr:winged helix-turn-helix transcriptional regulator [Erysipelotrichaceae bacterium]
MNKTEKAVLSLLIENAHQNAEELASEVGVTKRTIEELLLVCRRRAR